MRFTATIFNKSGIGLPLVMIYVFEARQGSLGGLCFGSVYLCIIVFCSESSLYCFRSMPQIIRAGFLFCSDVHSRRRTYGARRRESTLPLQPQKCVFGQYALSRKQVFIRHATSILGDATKQMCGHARLSKSCHSCISVVIIFCKPGLVGALQLLSKTSTATFL
jgi:hypothetical protein